MFLDYLSRVLKNCTLDAVVFFVVVSDLPDTFSCVGIAVNT